MVPYLKICLLGGIFLSFTAFANPVVQKIEKATPADRGLRAIGYDNVPEISRYLCELALNYYHFREFKKAIPLLREASHYPPFSLNLNIQTYNTMALAYGRPASGCDSHRS